MTAFPGISPTVPPYPVGIVPPRTKSPMSPPESSTIASYVTLRKTKKPESRAVGFSFWDKTYLDEIKQFLFSKCGRISVRLVALFESEPFRFFFCPAKKKIHIFYYYIYNDMSLYLTFSFRAGSVLPDRKVSFSPSALLLSLHLSAESSCSNLCLVFQVDLAVKHTVFFLISFSQCMIQKEVLIFFNLQHKQIAEHKLQ